MVLEVLKEQCRLRYSTRGTERYGGVRAGRERMTGSDSCLSVGIVALSLTLDRALPLETQLTNQIMAEAISGRVT